MDRSWLYVAIAISFIIAAVVGYELTNLGIGVQRATSVSVITKTIVITGNATTKEITVTMTKPVTITKILTSVKTITKTVTTTYVAPSTTSSRPTGTATATPRLKIELGTKSNYSIKEFASVIEQGASVPSSLSAMAYYLVGTRITTVVPTATIATSVVKLAAKAPISSYSQTNVQVSGIDELDVVKTDGRGIYYSMGNKVYIVDVANLKLASTIKLRNYVIGLYVWKNRLVVIAGGGSVSIVKLYALASYPIVYPYIPRIINVLVYDVSNLSKPKLIANVTLSGYHLSSRLYRGTLYVLTQMSAYMNGKIVLPLVNGKVLKPSEITVLSPGSTYLTILAFNISNLVGKAYVYLVNSASMIYMSYDHLYVVSNMYGVRRVVPQVISKYIKIVPPDVAKKIREYMERHQLTLAYYELVRWISKDYERAKQFAKYLESLTQKEGAYARIFVFKVKGLSIERVGFVDVPGVVNIQFAINQLGKYLVVASVRYTVSFVVVKPWRPPITTATMTKIPITICKRINNTMFTKIEYITVTYSPPQHSMPYYVYPSIRLSSVSVYVVDPDKLKIVASIPNVISREYVFSARLVGNVLFLVTNRIVDPLFAIDLSNPLKPRIVGFVKLPGYLRYLHPIAKGLLLGIGVEKGNLKVQIFNVSDLRRIEELSKLVITRGWSSALYDYHAVTFWSSRNLFMMPISINWRSVGAIVISYANDSLSLVKVLKGAGTIRVVWVGDKVFLVSPSSIYVYDSSSWSEIKVIKL